MHIQSTCGVSFLLHVLLFMTDSKNLRLKWYMYFRLKSDVEEKTFRYETLILERDTYQKEIDCLKHQNTDDLYLPQIKEVRGSCDF